MIRKFVPALAAAAAALAACSPADADNGAAGTAVVQDMPPIARTGFDDLLHNPATPFLGAENADVTIIGYVDYNCPYCKKMYVEIDEVLKADPKLRVLYKDWAIFGAVSENAARSALAAGYQGKYHAVHATFMKHPSRVTDDEIRRLLQGAGVDLARLDQDLETHRAEIDDVLMLNMQEAMAMGLQGTPAFIINGYLIPGGMPRAQLEAIIARLRTGQPLR